MSKIKVFEMFAGYGGASFALKKAGIEHEVVGYSEIDKYAIQCYEQNHKGKNFGDCTKINPNELTDFDLLTGGFPCQSFSTAGKGLGEQDPRGTLFYEIIRIAEVKKPKYMLLENVKGLTNKKFKDTFDKILGELDRIGYNVKWKVLNSKDFGIPQSRARVWFVCVRKDLEFNFEFPKERELKIFLKDILEDKVDEKYYLNEKQIANIFNKANTFRSRNLIKGSIVQTLLSGMSHGNVPVISQTLQTAMGTDDNNIPLIETVIKSEFLNNRVYGINGVAPTLSVKESKDVKILDLYNYKVKEDICPINEKTAQLLTNNHTIRKLTPKECFRLMGFLNDEINLEGLSNTHRYKLAGNGWDINLVSIIFKNII